jgi:poly-gamma-glutamate synthesis protein (capsule biosynthesis protein)
MPALLVASLGALNAAIEPRTCPPEITASAAGAAAKGVDHFSIVLAGNAAFNPAGAPVDPLGMKTGQGLTGFAGTLAGVANAVDGDLAFVNLETVITDRNDLRPDGRKAHVRSHPGGVKALRDIGFNLFSLANDHAMDYGAPGVEETLYHMAVANAERPLAFAGVGSTFDEATRPGCIDLGGTRIGFGAIGIIAGDQPGHRAGPKTPGQASYRNRLDFETVTDRLAALPANYRILSIHYGPEGRLTPDDRQLVDWRGFAAEKKGIDLIVGHQAPAAQGVELNGKSLIFYGLGDFLQPVAAEPASLSICRDYGLMAKVHLARVDKGFKVGAVEAIPLAKTDQRPERFPADESRTRIHVLNHLAAKLDDGRTAKGVRFTPRPDGSGLYCAEGAAALGAKLEALCRDWQPASAPPEELADEIAQACEDKVKQPVAKRRAAPRRPATRSRTSPPSPFGAFR